MAPKALEILSVLVSNAGHAVRKEDILTLVWPHAAVEEGNLAVHVCSLRKVLAERGSGTNHIQTIPKVGYRFAAPVRPVSQTETGAPRVAEHYLLQNTASGCRTAAAIYRKCIQVDPLDMAARAGLADSLLMRFIFRDLGHREGPGVALEVLADANRIDPHSAVVHLSRSRLLCVWDWQWQESADELERGLELAADEVTKIAARAWQGVCLARLGDLGRGLRQLHRAGAAFPLSPHVWFFLAEAHFLARDFSGSAAVCTAALQLHPHCWYLHAMAARPQASLGEHAAALRHLRMAKLLCPEAASGLVAAMACVHAMAGKLDRASALLARTADAPPGGHLPFTSLAMIHAALGDRHRALDYVEAACGAQEWYVPALKRDCGVDILRTSPRFRAALSRAGISA